MTNQAAPRIVVIAPNWLGDAVMSLPLIGTLCSTGGVRLCVMCPPYTARVYWGIDGIDELIVFPGGGFTRGLRWRSRVLRRLRPAVVIVLPPSFSSSLAPAAARVPFRVGYAMDGRRRLLRPAVAASRLRGEHLSQSYHHLGARALACLRIPTGTPGGNSDQNDAAPASASPPPKLRVAPDERVSVQRKLRERRAPLENFYLMVPGATYGNAKTWPGKAFRDAAQHLSRTMPVVLAGGRAEREVCADIARSAKDIHDMSGETSLGEFFALVEAAGVLVANDSGAAHVAGSLKTPAVVIFGSTSPRWTAPLGKHAVIVRQPTLCSPCYLKNCPTQLECFTGIRPEQVAEEALRLAKKGVDILPGGG